MTVNWVKWATFVGLWIVMLRMAGVVGAESAPRGAPTYHHVSLDGALPGGFIAFDPVKITNDGRIYGTAYECSDVCLPSILVYRRGSMNVLHAGIVYDVADDGTVGGSVVVDPVNFLEQAAIFRGSHQVEVIPRLPGELTSHVRRLATSGLALVESVDATTFVSTYYLRERGRIERLDLGQNQVLFLDMNDAGIVAGTSAPLGGSNMRAFRLAPSQGAITLLAPLPTDPDSWGLAINQCGDVLGYSFIPGAIERIGIWRRGVFDTLFVEGTPETPTISNRLLWNKAGLVVITDTNDLGSYLVPAPGVRRDLRELADVVPPWTLITGVNDDGDLIGEGGTARFSIDETFLLRRTR